MGEHVGHISRQNENGLEVTAADGRVFSAVWAAVTEELERLAKSGTNLVNREVAFGSKMKAAKQVRAAGTDWPGRGPTVHLSVQEPAVQGSRKENNASGLSRIDPPVGSPQFHNPYGFAPLGRRTTDSSTEFGDCDAPDQSRVLPGSYTGRLRVTLEAVTPLLLPDAAKATTDPNGHRTLPLRVRPDTGLPYLPPTTLKGSLRSLIEPVTRSRMGVFNGHDKPLGWRLPAQSGASAVPVRVVKSADGALHAELLTGTHTGQTDRPSPLYAAALPHALLGAIGHGDRCTAWLRRYEHFRNASESRPNFVCWRVEAIAASRDELATACPPPWDRSSRWVALDNTMKADGWVVATNLNIRGKHDERFFFRSAAAGANRAEVDLEQQVVATYGALIDDARATNLRAARARLNDRSAQLTDSLSETSRAQLEHTQAGDFAFSRHLTRPLWRRIPGADEEELFAYATVVGGKVVALQPVLISRQLNASAPADLLDPSLRRAADPSQLSFADRLFGWVPEQGGDENGAARRGRVRITPADVDRPGPGLDPPATLAILSTPKPSQGRFYLGTTGSSGITAALTEIAKADTGYTKRPNRNLRGWKHYPHHRSFSAEGGEWASAERSDQNQSVSSWVTPGTRFSLDIHLSGLDACELGALLWALDGGTDEAPSMLRLGGGKPLGFGSVRPTVLVDESEIWSDAELRSKWATLRTSSAPQTTEHCATATATFDSAVPAADPIRRSLDVVRRGVDGPVHSPRSTSEDDHGYEWFVSNEAIKRGEVFALSLPDLTSSPATLPMLPPR